MRTASFSSTSTSSKCTIKTVLQSKLQDQKVLAASSASPTVPFAPADLLKFNNKLFLTYHCMGSGYNYFCIPGCLIGAVTLPFTAKFKDLTRLQAAGTGAIIGGTVGMGLGALALVGKVTSKNPVMPFDEAGIQNRVDGMSHNYRIRAMDLGVWMGALAAGGVLAYNGCNATTLGLSTGTLGQLQAIGLGSASASVLTMMYVTATI